MICSLEDPFRFQLVLSHLTPSPLSSTSPYPYSLSPAVPPKPPPQRTSLTAPGIKRIGAPPSKLSSLQVKSLAPASRGKASVGVAKASAPAQPPKAAPAPKLVTGTSRPLAIQQRSSKSGRNMARQSQLGHWLEKVTVDGARYYVNPSTGEFPLLLSCPTSLLYFVHSAARHYPSFFFLTVVYCRGRVVGQA